MVTFSALRWLTRWLCAAVVLGAALFGAPGSAAAVSGTRAIDAAAIDSYIEAQMQKHGLPGVALAITQGDQIAYLKGYGSAGPGRTLTPQTPMYIGSSSKSFTALAIAQLAEQGKLDLDAPVQRYIPWFRVADEQASARLTVRHFVHHASGLSDAGFGVLLPDNTTLEAAVRALKDAQLTAPVGTKSQYFNLNYAVLALIIETVSQQPYAQYVTEHIFAPLGMTHTYTSLAAAQAAGLAQGYTRFFGFAMPMAQPRREFELADGYLISTAEDMARFVIAMNNGGQLGTVRILSPEWMQKLATPRQQAGFLYAMGWFVDTVGGIARIHHGGANETFKTFMHRYPTRQLGLVLMINQGYLIDHYISAEQLVGGVEQLVLGLGTPDAAAGIAVPLVGWGIGVLVVGLAIFQSWQVWRLRSWRERASAMPAARRAFDIGLNFAIPTAILAIVFWQLSGLFGDRFNLMFQASMVFTSLPDIGMLMLVSTIPDYAQGLIKVWWLLSAKQRPAPRAASAALS